MRLKCKVNPYAHAFLKPAPLASGEPKMRSAAQPVILVAEDNPNDERLLQWAFTNAGVTRPVQFVHNGAEAMDYLLGIPPFDDRARYAFPNLLIVDWKMPRVDGCELLSWLHKLPGLNQLPVAVMSGASWQEDFARARSLGANLYLNKWLEFSELVLAIKQLIAGKMGPPACRAEVTVKKAQREVDGRGGVHGGNGKVSMPRENRRTAQRGRHLVFPLAL